MFRAWKSQSVVFQSRPFMPPSATQYVLVSRSRYILPNYQIFNTGADPGGSSPPPPPPPPPPFPFLTTPLCLRVDPTYSVGNSRSSKLKRSSLLDFSNGKQIVTVKMNQTKSQLVLRTKTVLNSDHVHGESSTFSHIYLPRRE